MKTIIRKVEVEKEFYIANDGTEFEDEYKCTAYDMELLCKSFETYDEDFNRIEFESAQYVVVHSDEELDNIKKVCKFNGWVFDGLIEKGLYRYDSSWRFDRWEKVRIPLFLKDFIEFI